MKKLYERAVVEAFLRWKGLPPSALEDSERERPDALIRVDERSVGVEVTTLTEANPRQRIAPQKWTIEAIRVVEAARIAFESSNHRPFVVRFEFRPDWQPPDRRMVPLLAAELAAVVEAAGNEVSSDSETPLTLIDPHPAISWAYVGSTRPEWGGHWAPSFGFEGALAGSDDIASTVARKEAELAEYRRAASDVWLLIDCSLTGQGLAFYPPRAGIEVNTGFERVFCCGFGHWEWVEISCVRSASVIAATG